jgi:hypothetical protein
LLAVPASLFVGFVVAEPQIRLRARIWAGELRGSATPVCDFKPVTAATDSPRIRLDRLSLRVPADAGCPTVQASEGCVLIKGDGLAGTIFRPVEARVLLSPAEYPDPSRLPTTLAHDPAGLRAAAYAASSQNLSIWMSSSEIESLTGLLQAKPMVCLLATRVERLRSPHLSGVLVVCEQDEYVHLWLEYFSPPGTQRTNSPDLGGIASLVVRAGDSRAMDVARAIIGSFEIDG